MVVYSGDYQGWGKTFGHENRKEEGNHCNKYNHTSLDGGGTFWEMHH